MTAEPNSDGTPVNPWERTPDVGERGFDLTCVPLVCPLCLARGVVTLCEYHENEGEDPHHHCMTCEGYATLPGVAAILLLPAIQYWTWQ